MGCLVRSLSFDQKRFVTGMALVVLLLAAANHYFDWGLFGSYGKAVMLGVMLVVGLAFARFLPAFQVEMEDRVEAQQAAEAEAEQSRDKSGDAAEDARLRRAIGLPPPNTSSERTREG